MAERACCSRLLLLPLLPSSDGALGLRPPSCCPPPGLRMPVLLPACRKEEEPVRRCGERRPLAVDRVAGCRRHEQPSRRAGVSQFGYGRAARALKDRGGGATYLRRRRWRGVACEVVGRGLWLPPHVGRHAEEDLPHLVVLHHHHQQQQQCGLRAIRLAGLSVAADLKGAVVDVGDGGAEASDELRAGPHGHTGLGH